MKIYRSAADHVEHFTYAVMLPAEALRVPVEVLSGEYSPVTEPFDKNEMYNSKISISTMVNFVSRGIKFTIVKDNDVINILSMLDIYFDEQHAKISISDPNSVLFIRSALDLRIILTKLARRVLRKNPALADKVLGISGGKGAAAVLRRLDATTGTQPPEKQVKKERNEAIMEVSKITPPAVTTMADRLRAAQGEKVTRDRALQTIREQSSQDGNFEGSLPNTPRYRGSF